MTAVLCIILFSYLFLPVVSSNVVNVTENDNPSWLKMGYTEDDFSFSVVISDGTMTVGTQTGDATEMILFACDTGMLMYTDSGFRLIYQSAGNTVLRDSDATGVAVSSSNKTVTVIMGGVTYSMQMKWAYYPNEEGGYAYFLTDSYNFKQGDPVAVYGDFAGISAYNDMMSQNIGLDFKADVSGKHLNNMRWGKLAEGETAVDITTITGTAESETETETETESTVTNIVTGHTFTAMSFMNAGNSTVYTDGNWQYILDGTDAIITGYTGASVDTLTIPATVGGYSVKQVGNGTALLGGMLIRNLEISEGIQIIGSGAFNGCTNLALTTLPSGLTSIGNSAFFGCTNLALTSLPSGVTSIGNYVFYNCTSLALTSLPSNLTSIGISAFNGCSNLALTYLPSGLTTIGNSAFNGCTNLTSITVPSGVTSIGNYAFYNCTNLESLIIQSSPTIGDNAFQGCTNLKQILNLGETEITKTSYGLNADEVRTDIQADGCIAIIHDVQEKKDIVSTLMKILPIIILMVILVLIARPLFGMDKEDDDGYGSGSDDYEYY